MKLWLLYCNGYFLGACCSREQHTSLALQDPSHPNRQQKEAQHWDICPVLRCKNCSPAARWETLHRTSPWYKTHTHKQTVKQTHVFSTFKRNKGWHETVEKLMIFKKPMNTGPCPCKGLKWRPLWKLPTTPYEPWAGINWTVHPSDSRQDVFLKLTCVWRRPKW